MRTVEYLEQNVRTSILNDVRDVARYHSRRRHKKGAGYFGIPRQVFCYVDYLGLIAFGGKNKNTRNAIQFIRRYFPPSYRNYAELLYTMWRHGTVHQYEPQSFSADYSDGRFSVAWLSNNSALKVNRQEHMKFHSMPGSDRRAYLTVNICQLVDDLLTALDAFVAHLKQNRQDRVACEHRLNACGTIHNYSAIESRVVRDAVRNQIKSAWESRAGEIDRNGNVVKRF